MTRFAWAGRMAAATSTILLAGVLLAACGSSNNNSNSKSAATSAGTTSTVSTSAPAASAVANTPAAATAAATRASAASPEASETPRTAGTSGTVKSFVAALNKGDASAIQEYLAKDFTLTQANGQTVTGAGVQAALKGLATPITIKSVAAQGGHKTDAMLQFGSGPVMKVEFTGNSTSNPAAMKGAIASMKIGGS